MVRVIIHTLPVYTRLFDDYNRLKNTCFKNFFWGFTDLLMDSLEDEVHRAVEMLQRSYSSDVKVLILDIPESLLLVTDFYNFSDEIFAHEFPDELESHWESIYANRNSEKQCIFPYIVPEWVIACYSLDSFEAGGRLC